MSGLFLPETLAWSRPPLALEAETPVAAVAQGPDPAGCCTLPATAGTRHWRGRASGWSQGPAARGRLQAAELAQLLGQTALQVSVHSAWDRCSCLWAPFAMQLPA